MRRPPTGITGCIVARDAAALLPECIESMRAVVDEILVVDNGSLDATARVAEALGARLVPSTQRFHELARNAYLEAAETAWVLVLDADERLSEQGADAIPDLVADAPDDVLGFALERFDYFGLGRWASTRLVRLFRVDPRIRYFASRAHAAVAPAIDRAGGRVTPVSAPIHHLDGLVARDHSRKRADMRERLYTELELGAPPILRCFYALELFALGEDKAAEEHLAGALAAAERAAPIVGLFRAQQHRLRGRLHEAEREATKVLGLASSVFRGRDAVLSLLADVQDRLGAREEAIATARRATIESPGLASHHVNLAVLLEESAPEEARFHLERALEANPWLLAESTFGPGARPSVFVQQDALVARFDRGDALAARLKVGT